jgi:UDP-3-O-[3-hydroxymyristoyl] glucosamine N-acyltransferase
MRPLIFLGTSLQLCEFLEICDRVKQPVVGIIDKDYYGNTQSQEGVPFIAAEDTADFAQLKKEHDFFIGVNPLPPPNPPRNRERRKMFIDLVNQHQLRCANLIDPETRIYRNVTLGQGIFIAYTAVLGAHTEVGDHTQICAATGIGHNTKIGSNVIIQRQSAVISHATVGDNVWMGIQAKCLKPDYMQVGADSMIHPGVTVMRDVEPGEVISLVGKNTRKIYNTVVE